MQIFDGFKVSLQRVDKQLGIKTYLKQDNETI